MVHTKTLLLTSIALALALAGCSDDEPAPDSTPDSTDTDTATSAGPGAPGDQEPEAPADLPTLYLNGTVTGVIDCQLATQGSAAGAGPQQATSISVPAEAIGRSYSVELGASGLPEDPGTAAICVSWDGGSTWEGASGTVPQDAGDVQVAADTAYEHGFSIVID